MKDLIAKMAKERQLSGLVQYRKSEDTVCQKSDKRKPIDTKKEIAKIAEVSKQPL
jgi:hypothetical protein